MLVGVSRDALLLPLSGMEWHPGGLFAGGKPEHYGCNERSRPEGDALLPGLDALLQKFYGKEQRPQPKQIIGYHC